MKTTIRGLVACTLLLALMNSASAALVSRNILKTFFEKGDKPTEQQFSNLIDSFIHQTDDNLTIYALKIFPGAPEKCGDAIAGEVIDSSMPFALVLPGQPLPLMEPEFGGKSSFLPLILTNSLGEQLFGYFQVRMDDPLSVDPPGIHVDYFAFESTPGQSLMITSLPEPATFGLLAVGASGVALLAYRRRKCGT